ncbi:hypothetical protein ACJJTC_008875 [Scirpophaga incertulas]
MNDSGGLRETSVSHDTITKTFKPDRNRPKMSTSKGSEAHVRCLIGAIALRRAYSGDTLFWTRRAIGWRRTLYDCSCEGRIMSATSDKNQFGAGFANKNNNATQTPVL